MPDVSAGLKSTGPDNESPGYNTIILDRTGMTLAYVAVPAKTHEDATGQVVSMLDRHAIDLEIDLGSSRISRQSIRRNERSHLLSRLHSGNAYGGMHL